MIPVIPVVLGTIALTYITVLTTTDSVYLQGLATATVSGAGSIGATIYATQGFVGRLRRVNSRRSALPPTQVLFRHLNRQAIAALPSISSVLDGLSSHSGSLALVAANTLVSSPAVIPYIHSASITLASAKAKARVWFEPRNYTFDPNLWFEREPIYNDYDAINCGQDSFFFPPTGLCYRIPQIFRVRSLDVYRYDMKALAVYRQPSPLQACLPDDLSYCYRLNARSMKAYGLGKRVMTTMNRSFSVQPSLPVPVSYSGSNAVLSLDVYRPDMKALAILRGRTPPRGLFSTVLSTLVKIYHQGTIFLGTLVQDSIHPFLACVVAFIGVYTFFIIVLEHWVLDITELVLDPAPIPVQPVYQVVIGGSDNIQSKELHWWSLIPSRLSIIAHDQREHDQGPDDDVSRICTMNSHGVYKGPVATHQLVVPVALSGAFHLDSNLAITLPVDPIYISLPRSEDHGLEPAKFSTSSAIDTCPTQGVTTLSRAVDPSNIPLPSDNGPSNTDDPNKSRLISNHYETEASADKLPLELNGTTGPAPAHSDDRDASLSSADMSLESDFDATSHIVQGTIVTVEQDAGNNNKEPPVEDLPGSVWTDRILESRELFNDQAADDITVSNMTANMSLSSDILDELGGAVQERPANEPVKMAPRGEDIDHGNARLLEVPTVYPGLDDLSISSLGVSAPENHSAQITSLSQTAALIVPADTQRDNGDNSIDVSMDMSLETNAGNTEGEGNVLATDANVDGDKTSPFTDDDSHSTIPPSQDSFTMLPTTSSSEMITQEQADTFFDETSIGSFAEPPLLGLSTIEEENSLETRLAAQEEPTSGIYDSTNSSESTEHDSSPGPPSKISIAYGLPTEDSLDVTADMSLESQILDTDLRALEKSGDSWDGLATQMEKPHYRPDEPSGPLSDTHPALDSGLAWMTAAEEGPSEDIRTTTLETLEPDMDISELGMTTWTPDMDPCASTPDLDTLLSKSCPASLPGLVPIPPRPSSPDLAPAPLDHADSTVSDVDYTSEHESRAPTVSSHLVEDGQKTARRGTWRGCRGGRWRGIKREEEHEAAIKAGLEVSGQELESGSSEGQKPEEPKVGQSEGQESEEQVPESSTSPKQGPPSTEQKPKGKKKRSPANQANRLKRMNRDRYIPGYVQGSADGGAEGSVAQ